jgi:hypothetical protein
MPRPAKLKSLTKALARIDSWVTTVGQSCCVGRAQLKMSEAVRRDLPAARRDPPEPRHDPPPTRHDPEPMRHDPEPMRGDDPEPTRDDPKPISSPISENGRAHSPRA